MAKSTFFKSKKFKFIVLPGLMFYTVLKLQYLHYPPPVLEVKQARYEMSGYQMISMYKENPAKFYRRYAGEITILSGYVSAVGDDPRNLIAYVDGVRDLGALTGVAATFGAADENSMLELKQYDSFRAVCQIGGYSVFNMSRPTVNNCHLM